MGDLGGFLIWLWSTVTSAILVGAAIWLARKLIETRLKSSVEFEFNSKLENVRADLRTSEERLKAELRQRESEVSALRDTSMKMMASRHVGADSRRLQAIDQLWSALIISSKGKAAATMMAALKFEAVAAEAEKNDKARLLGRMISSGLEPKNVLAYSEAAAARPFISDLAWSIYIAYSSVIASALTKAKLIEFGLSARLASATKVPELVKAVLPPQYANYIDQWGEAGCVQLLDELERALLRELRGTLEGESSDIRRLAQTAVIARLTREVESDLMRPNPQVSAALSTFAADSPPQPE